MKICHRIKKGRNDKFKSSIYPEIVIDDALMFYEKAKAAGVDITFKAGKGLVHYYPLMAPMFKETTKVLNEIVNL